MIEKDFRKFDPKVYLKEYYSNGPHAVAGEDFSLYWYQYVYDTLKPRGRLLEFGGGPAIHYLITAAKYVKEIHFSDFLSESLNEINKWRTGRGHNWKAYIRRALDLEGGDTSIESIIKRENLLKEKITDLFLVDEREKAKRPDRYDILSVNFVPDSTTTSLIKFEQYTQNILGHLKHKGFLLMAVLKNSGKYKVGNKWFPSVKLSEKDFEIILQKLGIDIRYMASITTYDKKRATGGFIYSVGIKS